MPIQANIFTYSVGVPSGKDHLGSTRAVINTQNQVVSAQDGACPALDAGMFGATY